MRAILQLPFCTAFPENSSKTCNSQHKLLVLSFTCNSPTSAHPAHLSAAERLQQPHPPTAAITQLKGGPATRFSGPRLVKL